MHLLFPLSIWNVVPPLQPQLPNPRDWEGKGGKPDSGIPHKKIAGDPEPKWEAGCPWSGSSPSPDFPLGWGGHDSLAPASLVSLFAFLLLATWRRVQPLLPLTRCPG